LSARAENGEWAWALRELEEQLGELYGRWLNGDTSDSTTLNTKKNLQNESSSGFNSSFQYFFLIRQSNIIFKFYNVFENQQIVF